MLKTALENIEFLIANSAKKASRDPSEIMLLAVSKEADEVLIEEAIDLGLRDFGENRIKEALRKKILFSRNDIRLHFIGHLQTNKVNDAVKFFELIHSVDSLRLIEAINETARKIGKIQNILVEVNTSGEISKYGLKPEELEDFLKSADNLEAIKIKGLMTMAPLEKDKEKTRPCFRLLRELFQKFKDLGAKNIDFKYLSMGMSQDFEIAIEEGSNIVRIGTALFKR